MTDRAAAPPDEPADLAADAAVDEEVAETDRAIAQGLRFYVLRGLKWSAIIVFANQISRMATSLVLVRLLQPDDYGLAGMALIFAGLVMALSDVGLGTGLVQRPSISERDRSTVFWTGAAIGVVLVTVGIAISGALASFFHEPEVRTLFIAVSISFMFPALQTVPAALLQRSMDFRAITIRSVGASAGASIVGIVGALIGWGAWALIAYQLALGFLSTVLLWTTVHWRPRFMFSRESLRNLGGFGIKLFGARSLEYVQGNADNILVGRYLGASALGLYSVAYNVILLPLERLFVPLQSTLFPAFSRIQDDRERLAAVWLRIVRVVAALVVPAMLGLIVIAPDFVSVVLGDHWNGCVRVVQLLALVTMMMGFTAVGERTLLARGLAGMLLRISALRCVLAVAAFVAGLHWGIVGIAFFYTVSALPVQSYVVYLSTRELGVPRRVFVRNVLGVAEAAAAMFVVCWLSRMALVSYGVPADVRLVTVIVIGAATYLGLINWRAPEVVTEAQNLIPMSRWLRLRRAAGPVELG